MTQTNNEREALLNKFREIIAEQGWQCRDMTEKLIDAAYAHIQSPISQNEQQEAALKVYQGEICYKSHADDQSYGMWCPVGYDTTQLYKEGTEFFTSTPKQIPDGWKLVPIEPTDEMIKAMTKEAVEQVNSDNNIDQEEMNIACYKAMINAAPANTEVGE